MSNPLAAFRKYQKAMLLVAAVGAMLAFGILPVMSEWLGSSGGPTNPADENPVVASWKGGELRRYELQNHIGRRQMLASFQQAVRQTAAERGAESRAVVVPNTLDEQNVIETVMLAKKAEELGIVVSDNAVIQHLEGQLANGTMTGNELAAILETSTMGRMKGRRGQTQMIEGFKMEMAAHRLRVLANGGSFTGSVIDNATTPAQALEYFKRLNRRMEAEVVEIAAEDFLAQVSGEPTDAEITALYEEYKAQLANPSLPDPGFREPTRVSFDWLKADFPTILEREIGKLTEEELRTSYEETKESYRKASLPTDEEIDKLVSTDDESDTDSEAEGDKSEDDSSAADYMTFEEARNDVAAKIARPKASDAIRDAVTQAMDEIKKYHGDYAFWQATGEDEGETPPPAPSVNEMATRLGLRAGNLNMISFTEAADYEIGSAFDFRVDAQNRPQKIIFAQKAFQPKLEKFSAQVIFAADTADSQYVFWKTDQRDQYVPKLEEARPAIVRHWKMKKALELAKASAEETIAKKLQGSKQSLATLLEGDATKKVVDTGEFTWMTYGSTFSGSGQPRQSQVEGVEYAGPQFMKDVSALESGESVVTYNNPETKAYVVYMKAVTSDEEDLRQLFIADTNKFAVRLIAAGDEFSTARDWFLGVQDAMNFEIAEPEVTN